MKRLIIINLLLGAILPRIGFSQTWQSIYRVNTFEYRPYNQFSINPYTNDIWLVDIYDIAVIENDGDIVLNEHNFNTGYLCCGKLGVAFTPTHQYYIHDNGGLFQFDNYISVEKYHLNNDEFNGTILSNGDTLYITQTGPGYGVVMTWSESDTIITNRVDKKVAVNSNYHYALFDYGDIRRYLAIDGAYNNLTGDPEYLFNRCNDMKFSRYTDTLYVATVNGISRAYIDDFVDNFSQANTSNMPSNNVLELEFDANDDLWAVFGDANDEAIAIARLEGTTWTDLIDGTNSPIYWGDFYGLEFDTLGNLWVAAKDHLHTILTPNSPGWLGLHAEPALGAAHIYPNPSSGELHIELPEDVQLQRLIIRDLFGREVIRSEEFDNAPLDLPQGSYFLEIHTDRGTHYAKWVRMSSDK